MTPTPAGKKGEKMKITWTEKNGEVVVATNPSDETIGLLRSKIANAFQDAIEAEVIRVREGLSNLKEGGKKVFLTKPIRIEISR